MGAIVASSAEKVKQDAVPVQMLAPEEGKGRIRISKTTYTWTTGNIGSGSTITGALLPKGARVIGGVLFSQAGVASHTLQASINSVNLAAALAVGAAAVTQVLPDAANFHNVVGVDFGGYAPVITSGGADAVVGNKVALLLKYVVD